MTEKGWTLDRMVVEANKICGPGTCFTGAQLKRDPVRLPTGVFSVDYAIGGGVPIWGTVCLWGPESGAKTYLALKAASICERICWRCFNHIGLCDCSSSSLMMKTFWADAEGTLDQGWAEDVGCTPEKYYVALADYGEQYANMADSALQADDCGLLVIDSLAGLTPASEMMQPAEDDFIALQSRMITRMIRRLKQRIIRERKRDHPCTIIFTNQMRKKIVTFGDPETMTGGHAMLHEFSLLLRCSKKTLTKEERPKYTDSAANRILATRHSVIIRKEKVLTLANSAEFVVVRGEVPDLGLKKGMVDDFATVMTHARQLGLVAKDGKHWKYLDRQASKLDDIKLVWKKRPEYFLRTKMEIIRQTKEQLSRKDDDDGTE